MHLGLFSFGNIEYDNVVPVVKEQVEMTVAFERGGKVCNFAVTLQEPRKKQTLNFYKSMLLEHAEEVHDTEDLFLVYIDENN